MAERERYNPETGEYELAYDDGIYETNPYGPQPTAPEPSAASGPPYTTANPPPAPPDGYEYILNPTTGEFELRPRATNPTAPQPNPEPTPEPTPPPYEPGPIYDDPGGGGALTQFNSTGFEWPSYTSPTYQSAGPFTPRQDTFAPSKPNFSFDAFVPSRPTFDFDPFTAPTADQARNAPGYQAAATEARKQLEAGAAYRGTLRSGMTLGDILKQQTALGDQNYNNVFGRELEGYKTNRGNAFENWAATTGNELNTYKTNRDNAYGNWAGNLNAEKSIFDTNYGVDTDIFDRLAAETDKENNYKFNASQAEFAPKQRKAELTFADLYSRWRDLLNSTTQIATAGD